MEDFIRLLAKQQSLSGGTSLISMYIPPNVTLHRILMLKVKARARHAFTLKQRNLF